MGVSLLLWRLLPSKGEANTLPASGRVLGSSLAVATARTQSISSNAGTSAIATTNGFQAALWVGAGFAALGIVVAVLMIRGKSDWCNE